MPQSETSAVTPDEANLNMGERQRVRTLGSLHILHSAPEERFDRITRLARESFDTPYAYVNLVAENYLWTKSQAGNAHTDILPRRGSPCVQAIRGNDTFVVADLATDSRFSDSPLVKEAPHMRFYAGRPLRATNGHALGTLCVMDHEPRFVSEHELTLLDDLGVLIERELESQRAATVDELTGVVNLRGFSLLGPSLLESCRLNRHNATLACFNLVAFEEINQRQGHQVGDEALRQFARLVRTASRKSDLFARLGDDEFALLAGGARPEGIKVLLGRIDAEIDVFHESADCDYRLAFRYGLSTIGPSDTASLTELLEEAETDMAKRRHTHELS